VKEHVIPKDFSEIERTYLDEIPIIQVGYSNFNAQPIRVLWVLWILPTRQVVGSQLVFTKY
jgi:hypothetical protein